MCLSTQLHTFTEELTTVLFGCDNEKTVAFKDLSYSVVDMQNKTTETKHLLQGLHGVFHPGEMTALMGSRYAT